MNVNEKIADFITKAAPALKLSCNYLGTVVKCLYFYNKPQIRNYAPNMIQKRKESASLVKRGTVHRMSP